jgi:two-component system, OmpR family, response regulator CpxR
MHHPQGWSRSVTQINYHNAFPSESRSSGPPGGAVAAEQRLVLVVDDEMNLLEVTSFVLESEGFVVETARNGREAIERLRAGPPPGLVLLDLMMPVMNGWEFLEEIAKVPSFRIIPVIVLTAGGPGGIPGAVEVLRKPFDLAMLVELVERHVLGCE